MPSASSDNSAAVHRIGHLMPYPAIGGTEQATLRMATVTQREGLDNHFFVPTGFDEVASFFTDHGFAVHRTEPMEPSLRHIARHYRESKRAAKRFRDLGIDLLHAADLGGGYENALAAKLSRVPLVCHVRNPRPELSMRDRAFLRLIDHWLFVSSSTKDLFAAAPPASRSDVLYDGIDVPELIADSRAAARSSVIEEFGLDSDSLIVGMVARVARQKDHLTLAKALLQLADEFPNLVVLAVGPISKTGEDAPSYLELEQFLAARGLSDRFVLVGYRTDTQRFMAALDVHVLSTHFEGFGLVIHEAMAKGTPVVATAVGGTVEAMKDGVGGFLVAPGDASQLAARIRDLLADRGRAEQMGRDGYEFVKANFSSERFRERILAIYGKLLKK